MRIKNSHVKKEGSIMEQREEVEIPREQEKALEKLRTKAKRVKLATLRESMKAMEQGASTIALLRGVSVLEAVWSEDRNSPLAREAVNTVYEVLRERMGRDGEALKEALEHQDFLEVERDGATYQRLGSAVEDGEYMETFAITHRGRKARLISLRMIPGELSNGEIVGALECIYAIVRGTDSGVQVIDARSTVKVQEIVANEEAPLRLKGIALYSTFDQTLYNIDWSSDARVSAIDIEPFFYRRDRIQHYEREMKRIFAKEIHRG